MKGVFDFVIEPLEERYTNNKKVGDTNLILNTELQNHNYVSRVGIVKYVPLENENNIQPGDKVIVHHNVFRRFRDIRGNEKNSKSYYDENTYFAQPDQVFSFNKGNKWEACIGFNFVQPIKETKLFSSSFEKPLVGILKTKDPELDSVEVNDVIGFRPTSEYEFVIDEERFYRVPTNSITIKYGHQGNQEKYNPSWTRSGGGIDKSS